jgi:hypothetical protein
MKPRRGPLWPPAADEAVRFALMVFVLLLTLFPLRNNDIWWHLAVGKHIAGGSFITTDPFMFSVPGLPWVPHAWLAGLLFFGVYALFSAAGLVALRAVVVAATVWVALRLVKRFGIPFVLAAPVVLIVVLNAHSRFILRPHLFEYLFLMLLLWHLVARSRRGIGFYLLPVVMQILWVNLHASFYLGPIVVLLFFLGEAIAARYPGVFARIRPDDDEKRRSFEWKPVGSLLGMMVGASLVNPRPFEFVLQPLNAEQRQLLTQYTLEWQSPFDPAMKAAAFHPYYEILLGIVAVAFLLSLRRLRPASVLLVALFAALSLQAHRFRVEFALLALPLALEQLHAAGIIKRIQRWVSGGAPVRRIALAATALVVSVVLVATARDRVEVGTAVSDRFPKQAFQFVRENDVARRSFHTVGFGSYLIGTVFPDRQSFVDGRNIHAPLYRDFLACQTASAGFNAVIRKYDLDGFIIPAPEKSDGGIRNVHGFLMDAREWVLVHMDRNAFVYVKERSVPAGWLEHNAYRLYHPMTFGRERFSGDQLDALESELRRAIEGDALYGRAVLDAARFLSGMGRRDEAIGLLDSLLEADPENEEAGVLRRQL